MAFPSFAPILNKEIVEMPSKSSKHVTQGELHAAFHTIFGLYTLINKKELKKLDPNWEKRLIDWEQEISADKKNKVTFLEFCIKNNISINDQEKRIIQTIDNLKASIDMSLDKDKNDSFRGFCFSHSLVEGIFRSPTLFNQSDYLDDAEDMLVKYAQDITKAINEQASLPELKKLRDKSLSRKLSGQKNSAKKTYHEVFSQLLENIYLGQYLSGGFKEYYQTVASSKHEGDKVRLEFDLGTGDVMSLQDRFCIAGYFENGKEIDKFIPKKKLGIM